MSDSVRSRLRTRGLISVGAGIVLVMGSGLLPAAADEIDHGDNQVTITVTIGTFDPCEFHFVGCDSGGGNGDLAATGMAIGVPLGSGILLTGLGLGIFAVTRRRRTIAGG